MNCQPRNVAGDVASHPAIAQAIAEFDAVLGSIMRPRAAEPRGGVRVPMSVWTDEHGAHVELDLPGVPMDAIEITIERDVLTIKGNRVRMVPSNAEVALDELRAGEFERHVRISDSFDQEKVSATLKDGVLRVSLARKPQTQPRKVTIAAS
ncbi:MAG: Hsp20/alpha crystallin family protein [Phycisphaerales bacterium]|nr:Hsp20/alpha crystallin family protein [Phycisphaerales bacterium]